MANVASFIDSIGGTVKVATALDLTPSVVSSWKTSNRIPRWRLDSLREIAEAEAQPFPFGEAA